jgi:phosphoglucomutase
MIINQGTKTGMDSKGRNHVRSIKPLEMLVPNRINKIIIEKEGFLPLTKLKQRD